MLWNIDWILTNIVHLFTVGGRKHNLFSMARRRESRTECLQGNVSLYLRDFVLVTGYDMILQLMIINIFGLKEYLFLWKCELSYKIYYQLVRRSDLVQQMNFRRIFTRSFEMFVSKSFLSKSVHSVVTVLVTPPSRCFQSRNYSSYLLEISKTV